MNRYTARPGYSPRDQWGSAAQSPREKWNDHVQATNMRSQMQLRQFMTQSMQRAEEEALRQKLEECSPRAQSPRAQSPRAQSPRDRSLSPRSRTQKGGLYGSTRSPRQLVLKTDKSSVLTATQQAAAAPAAAAQPSVKDLEGMMKKAEEAREAAKAMKAPIAAAQPVEKPPSMQEIKQQQKTIGMAVQAVNSHFSNMFKAFQYIDVDGSGSIGAHELKTALRQWNVGLDEEQANELLTRCDPNGDGQVSYSEFVDALARDTVAPSAMGKRDMQALEAMGVADLDPEFLGHKHVKNYKIGE